MSHYAEYVKERLGKLIFECDEGFAVYWYLQHPEHGFTVYIEDIYVVPEARKKNVASWMADQIVEEAQGRGASTMLGSVNPKANGATTSLKVLLAYGMTLDGPDATGLIFFSKHIGE